MLVLTAAVRDLHFSYPNRFQIQVRTTADVLWQNTPYVQVVRDSSEYLPGSRVIQCEYPAIHQSNQRPLHFLQAYHEYLSKSLGVRLLPHDFKGQVFLSESERSWPSQLTGIPAHSRFWIIVAGGKYDFTTKWWNPESYQAIIDHFGSELHFVQCGESNHWHPPLDGVCNLVGRTSIRQFLQLVHHAEGVICPITFAMHAAAAVETREHRIRPCIVIAGGREPNHWETYPGHTYLHTIGALDCCATGGCWKSRCQLVGDGDKKDYTDICTYPVRIRADLCVPRCMEMIKPQDVIRAITQYDEFSKQ